MLWSLIKIVVFVVLVAAATFGSGQLLEMDGGIRIEFLGEEYNLTPLMTVIALVLLVLGVWILLKLAGFLVAAFRFLNGDETAISRWFDRNRERKGYDALSEGMMALASGEGKQAMAKAARAERYLQKPELTNLLTAQAAEMSGDRKKAEQVYTRLLKNDKTRFVGVRGIMKQKLADGETDTALKLAQTAFSIKPSHAETQDILLQLQAGEEDWKGARETLDAKLKYGTLPRDVHKRREAVLALGHAREVFEDGSSIEAREAAIEANRLSPDLIPAAVLAARSYIKQEKPRYAARVIKKTWQVQPHPDLAAVFAEIAPDETPVARLKRFRQLTKLAPDHRETKLLQAELQIAAEDFPEARRALGDLTESAPDARVLTILAAIERGEGANDAVVRGRLTQALTAPRGPQWVCDKCNQAYNDWTPVCDGCDALDTLTWKTPPQAEMALPAGTAMLPLIVGAIEDKSDNGADPEAEIASEVAPEPEILDAEEVLTEPAPELVTGENAENRQSQG